MQNIIRTEITDASAWRGAQMRLETSWILHLTKAHIAEIDQALSLAMSSGIEVTQMTREHFPLPGLAQSVALWVEEIQKGRGFVLVRGLPVERYDNMQVRVIFWGLS